MNGITLRDTLPVLVGIAAAAWMSLAVYTLAGRLATARRQRRLTAAVPVGGGNERKLIAALEAGGGPRSDTKRAHALRALARSDHPDCREFFERALDSADEELRLAAVAGLGHLAAAHDWAVDALITALMERSDTPARVAAQLARLAPRPGARLVPLLGHPDDVVRFWAARLIAAQGSPTHPAVASLTRDPSPRVRAAALSALRATADPDALRSALELLGDPAPPVRAHACRATAALGGVTMAAFLVPLLGDTSWWVREAAQESIRGLGPAVVGFVVPGLSSSDGAVRHGVAIVLQDLGIVDSLLQTGHDHKLLESIFDAGGADLRAAAEQRAAARVRPAHESTSGYVPAVAVS